MGVMKMNKQRTSWLKLLLFTILLLFLVLSIGVNVNKGNIFFS